MTQQEYDNRTVHDDIKELLEKTHNHHDELWAILTSLRGPDVNVSAKSTFKTLKTLTTGRIRQIVVPHTLLCEKTPLPLSKKSLELRNKIIKTCYYKNSGIMHFLQHYFEAVYAIKVVYGYDLLTEQKVSDETDDARKRSAETFLAEFRKQLLGC